MIKIDFGSGRVMFAWLGLVAYVFFVAWVTQACQPPSPNTSPNPPGTAAPAPGASLVRDVVVQGSGNVRASMTLDLGIMVIPLHLVINAHADPGGAGGTLDVGVEGLLDGHCKLIGGVGDCAASGLLVPKPQPVTANPPPALKVEGSQDASNP